MVRQTTSKVLEMADEGLISYKSLAEMALKWMSEDDVAEMLRANEINLEDETETEAEEESWDYIINAGDTLDTCDPFEAHPTKESAIRRATELSKKFKYVEVVYMPEADLDTNDLIFHIYR